MPEDKTLQKNAEPGKVNLEPHRDSDVVLRHGDGIRNRLNRWVRRNILNEIGGRIDRVNWTFESRSAARFFIIC